MTLNVGSTDRALRFGLGAVLIVLALLGAPEALAAGWPRWAAGLAGLVLLGTAALRFCPAYRLLGLRTCRA